MKKTLLVMGLLALTTTSTFASVVKGHDSKRGCTLYRVIHSDSKKQIQENETVFLNKEVYGITFENLAIDFDNREAQVDVVMNVVLGLNRNIAETKSIIPAENTQFTALINQVNRKISLLESVCLNANNEIVYAKTFENN